jgi:1,4-alpha-glucan branching enzyme
MKGYLAIVLHAHLPFVRHPEHDDFLEEDWLYEAISETYLPLLTVFDRLAEDGVPFRLTMTLSPTLSSMLTDELLMQRYAKRLDRTCELVEKEVHRTQGDRVFNRLAHFYRDHLASLRSAFYDRYRENLVGAFRSLQDRGYLEIITCCATHGFLPLMQRPEAVRAQVAVGVSHHSKLFGSRPRGIWLPECGYFLGLDSTLAAAGLRYFFLDAHGIEHADPSPVFGVYAPIYTPAGVAAFGRDPESSEQVWSAEYGYPGDPVYREFYRDIGWDLDQTYIQPYIQATGERKNTGIKYFRITGNTSHKAPYEPELARSKAAEHAAHFMFNRQRQIDDLSSRMAGRPPVVTAPYDAELFGHWWFEGPLFLEALIRKSASEQSVYRLATPGDFLRENPENQVCSPTLSSWGKRGYSATWLDESNDWIYRHLHHCADRMVQLARDCRQVDPLRRRALNQAARELLLAQASDWAFIIETGTMVDYAIRRTQEHLLRFLRLEDQIRQARVDESWLAQIEGKDNIFPDLDYQIYRP